MEGHLPVLEYDLYPDEECTLFIRARFTAASGEEFKGYPIGIETRERAKRPSKRTGGQVRSCIPPLVLDLVAGVDALKPVLESIEAEWQPEPAPPTMSFADVGRGLVERIDDVGRSNAVLVFDRIEQILCHGTERDKDAAATGFLEAIVGGIERAPERAWILELAGPQSRSYVAAWDRFCGVERLEPRLDVSENESYGCCGK